MKDRGFIIYRCKGELGAHHIQIANMGELPDATIDAFLGAMAEEVGLARAAASAKDRERPIALKDRERLHPPLKLVEGREALRSARAGAARTRRCCPWPISLSTPMRPPWASTASLQK
jgi:hypothetical protein